MKLMIAQVTILLIMLFMLNILMFKKKLNLKTMSPFECGYNSMHSNLPMSIQFTLLVFMFLLFDVELSILISANWKLINMNNEWILTMMIFLMLMLASISYEMVKKSFKWN